MADNEQLGRYFVGVRKVEAGERDIFHEVFPDDAALAARGFRDCIGASDEPGHPVGMDAVYSVLLTAEEVRRFADADNLRYLELEPASLRLPPPEAVLPVHMTTGGPALL